MIKKISILVISLLVITNIFSLYKIKGYKDELNKQEKQEYKYYTLSSQNENWIVEDCKLLLTADKYKAGEGIFKYKGNAEDINSVKFYEVELVKVSKTDNSDKEALYNTSASSNVEGVLMSKESKTFGSISGPIKDVGRYDLGISYDVYFIIKYDKGGRETIEEKILLNVEEIDLDFFNNRDTE